MDSMESIQQRQKELSLELEALEAQKAELRRQERLARQAAQRAEEQAHRDKMYADVGQPLAGLSEAQHNAVYAMAWQHGHSYGYSEVESYYGDFAELARRIIELSR